MAYCYNATGKKCSGKAQPGVVALRKAVRELFPGIGDLGIYNCRPTRGGGSLSTHGEGRGWDAKCNATTKSGLALGNRLAAWLVLHAQELGIQRVIWNRRQWDSKTRTWRKYSGQSPHTNHLHIELCWKSARDQPLTVAYIKTVFSGGEEFVVDKETAAQIRAIVAEELKKVVGAPYFEGQTVMKSVTKKVGRSFVEHDDILEAKLDQLIAKLGA